MYTMSTSVSMSIRHASACFTACSYVSRGGGAGGRAARLAVARAAGLRSPAPLAGPSLPRTGSAAPTCRGTSQPVTCRSGGRSGGKSAGSRRNRTSRRQDNDILATITEEVQDIIREAPRKPERAVALLVGLAGATLFIGPLLGTVGFAAAVAGTAVMSSMAFGGMMMAFGMMMATMFTFGFLSLFGTMFGVFVLPSLAPLLFVGAGAALFISSSRNNRREDEDVDDYERDNSLRESPAERTARLEVEKVKEQAAEREREVAEELKAFDTLLNSRTKDNRYL